MPLTITLNGDVRSIPLQDYPLASLLAELKLENKPVVIEINGQAVSPQLFSTTIIHPQDTLEIISIVAGG